ncbi:uncharacterized protein CC84DRAFT_1260897 [Paraphaeosphaeria sporulosa]|uniref:N-acetyltransferase domain-containing protein n=1 Tax=Paraphaeosphaeria sporulosa TaxID=1460663 RepID=A0A177C852_9PLEO|nr:uncharacterized protein CC84DRAFT_1260897 [Paraphaeosphaeria sporulosa]OAG03823.1 hypothetical protein CC84DRAFT_1260897 [Paraphaeosphaeria sporulosa]
MAHLARVSREMLYAQPPPQFEESGQSSQQNMAQPKGRATEQPTWQHEQMSKAFKKSGKKSKWQKLDIHHDTIADYTHDADPPVRLASHLHQFAPSTPAPSDSTHDTPSPNAEQSKPHKGPHKGGRNGKKMASRYVPPHLRKKQSNGDALHADTANPTPEMKVLKLEGADPSEVHFTQPQLLTVETRPEAPLSPPASPAEQQAQGNGVWGYYEPTNAAWGNDDPKPEPPTGGPNPWKRGKRHVWPKNRDIKPIPDDEEDGGVECKSECNGDPDYDVRKLVDWNGDWLPPPETWSARHAFTDRHFGAGIEKWINGHDKRCIENQSDLLRSVEFEGVEGGVVLIDGEEVAQQTINYEIVPRSWIATKIEGDPPQDFWKAFAHRAPAPLSDIDITEHRPFWDDYLDNTTNFLNPMQHPAKAELDMNDEENHKQAAGQSATQYLRHIHEKNQIRKRRHQAKLAKKNQNQNQELPPRDPGYRPISNIYLRPVVAADAKGIQELYNYYVTNSFHTHEHLPRATKDIVERIRNITDEGLPYIVAVLKGSHLKGPQAFVNEHIVGIAYIDDFVDKGSMCRYTFELECYVHPDFARQNIAKCLFDRLLSIVNPSYPVRGGYNWVNRGEYLKNGPARVVKVINCHVYHEAGDDVVWVTEFMRKFKFRKAGHLFKMGYKYGKIVDLIIYQHETGEDVDPNVPPMTPL